MKSLFRLSFLVLLAVGMQDGMAAAFTTLLQLHSYSQEYAWTRSQHQGGGSLAALPSVESSPNEYVTDPRLSKQRGFTPPPEISRQAAFLNPTPSFYVEHRSAILVTLYTLATAVLVGISVVLLQFARKNRQLAHTAQQLVASETYLRTILDAEPECVKVINADGTLEQMNPAGLAMIEAQDTPALVLGKQVLGLIKIEHRRAFQELTQRVLRGGSGSLAFEIVGLQGTHRWLETHAVPLKNAVTGEIKLLGVTRDITQRKLAEQYLVDSEMRTSQIFELAPEAMFVVNEADGRVMRMNGRAKDMFGYTHAELLGQPMHRMLPAYRDAQQIESWLGAGATSTRQNLNLVGKRRDGHEFSVLVGLARLRTEEYSHLILTVVDLSERQALEQALLEHQTHLEDMVAERTADLEASRHHAERLARVKSEFLANMSHEIRTPMNAVLGLAQIGARDNADNKAYETFAKIQMAGRHLLGVINDILDYSKLDSGKIVVEQHPFALFEMLDSASGFVVEQATQKGLGFEMDIAPDIPAWVRGDEQRLRQILVNLLANAVKFTDHGEIRLCVARQGKDICFKVIDSGKGMSPELIQRLFKPFEQADSSITREFGGTGLGLAISQGLAQLMGGEIVVESTFGVGSRFSLQLPLPAAESASPQPGSRASVVALRLAGMRILAVEDIDINRFILDDLLRQEGAVVQFAEHGQDALDKLATMGEAAFDIVLMDVQMPVMDGYEATRHLRRLAPGLPVVGLTAHALPEERERGTAAGMVGYLTKPVELDELVATIRLHVEPPARPLSIPVPPDESLIDWLALQARYEGRQAFVLKLAGSVLSSQADMPVRLRLAASQNDAASLAFLAHAAKGAFGNLMAWKARESAARAEVAAREGDPDAAALCLEVADAVDDLLIELGSYVQYHHIAT